MAFLTVAQLGCARPSSVSGVSSADTIDVQRAALTSLFIEREHGKVGFQLASMGRLTWASCAMTQTLGRRGRSVSASC